MALERTKEPQIQHNKNRFAFHYLRLSTFVSGLNTLHSIGQWLNSSSKTKNDAVRFANRVSAFICVHLRLNIIHTADKHLNSASKIKNNAIRFVNLISAFICFNPQLIELNGINIMQWEMVK